MSTRENILTLLMKHTYPILPLLCLTFLTLVGCSEKPVESAASATPVASSSSEADEKPDTLITGGYDPVEMEAAVARARSEVDHFLEVLQTGDADSFLVKAPITEGDNTEHFWIKDVTFEDGVFKGLISNDPGMITTVTYGQAWSVAKDEITDWVYNRGDRMHGGYTIDPLLSTWDPERAEEVRKRLVR